jgi:DNA-binding NarL/FixJ family response regulator
MFEHVIISGVVAGRTDREIAEHLDFTEDGVKDYLSFACEKLGVSREELVGFAIDHTLPKRKLVLYGEADRVRESLRR